MSPEQGMGKSGEKRSDIYSLGVMFYELSCGQLPFVSENPFAQVMMHINDAPAPPSSIAFEIPGNVEKVILKSMEKEPDRRYSTIDLMLKDISQLSEAKTEMLPTARMALGKDLAPGTLAPTVSGNVQVSLHILDTGQFLFLSRGQKYTLGRSNKPISTSIDLSPFKAYEWGISRKHAELDLGDSIVLRDLESSNGTRYNGKKLSPFVPMEINHGDTFRLGKLKIQVLVYED
jgi:serine/threonine protein kinase